MCVRVWGSSSSVCVRAVRLCPSAPLSVPLVCLPVSLCLGLSHTTTTTTTTTRRRTRARDGGGTPARGGVGGGACRLRDDGTAGPFVRVHGGALPDGGDARHARRARGRGRGAALPRLLVRHADARARGQRVLDARRRGRAEPAGRAQPLLDRVPDVHVLLGLLDPRPRGVAPVPVFGPVLFFVPFCHVLGHVLLLCHVLSCSSLGRLGSRRR